MECKIIVLCIVTILTVLLTVCIFIQYVRMHLDMVEDLEHENRYIKVFYPLAMCIYKFMHRKLHLKLSMDKSERYSKIYLTKERNQLEVQYYSRMFAIMLMATEFMLIFALAYIVITNVSQVIYDGYYIEKNAVGGSDREVDIEAHIGDENREITITIPSVQYSATEISAKMLDAKQYVQKHFLGANKSADNVTSNLNFITSIPDNAIKVSWQTDQAEIISDDGTVSTNDLSEDVQVELTAIYRYEDYKEKCIYNITVQHTEQTAVQRMWNNWYESLNKVIDSTRQSVFVKLPEVVEGHEITYSEVSDNSWITMFLLMLILICIVPVIVDYRIREAVNKRDRQLQLDYPELIERFVLLISAGLNIKGAWYRITDEYIRKSDNTGQQRFLYEEMILSRNQMENGMSEMKAYELFGRRIGLLPYMKFSTLLVQNLRKGTSDLLRILDYEAADVLKERKENVKVLGEEAGTKLLLPMMLMLIIVFAIILYAAFANM